MSHIRLHRPARMVSPPSPGDEIVVRLPPPLDEGPGFGWWQLLFPALTGLGSLVFVVVNPTPTYAALTGAIALGSLGMGAAMFLQQRSARRRRLEGQRERYRTYLSGLAAAARRTASLQDEVSHLLHPGPAELWALACRRTRVWERRPEHPDFARVRIGTGAVPLSTPLRLEDEADLPPERDPHLVAAARRLVERCGTVPNQPVTVDLRAHPVLSLLGPRGRTRDLARAMVLELATLCAPEDLAICLCYPASAAPAWEFARWLPHAASEDGRTLLCPEDEDLADLLADEVSRRRERARRPGPFPSHPSDRSPERRLLLVVDGFSATSPLARSGLVRELAERAHELEVSLVFLVEAQRDEPPAVDLRVLVEPDGSFSTRTGEGWEARGRTATVDPRLGEAVARRLAPLRLADRAARNALSETCRLVELLGADSAREVDVERAWRERPRHDLLRVPIGVGGDGRPLILDLKEPAGGGIGPHGLIVGATGSGKSELLRTLVSALAATHPPELLAFVLVDFKGGAAFAGLAELPHVAGMITNLADDLTMVDRVQAALFGEVRRRQQLLRRAGNLDDIHEYQRRRAAGLLPGCEPLPYLLIVVDEFGELLAGRPDFIELFTTVGRVGRSLGMHLVLASQRLEQGRLRGLESHLSYRICLRTFSAAESQVVIGTPDAYRLPPIPGSAYLQADTTVYERFRVAMVSSTEAPASRAPVAKVAVLTAADGTGPGAQAEAAGGARTAGGPPLAGPTDMSVLVERIQACGAPRVHRIWLPPLEPRLPLRRLLGSPALHPSRGLQAREAGWWGSLRVPVGLLDLPLEQEQRPFVVDLAGWAGHLLVVGAPQSGKSTFLRTIVLSLIVTHTPAEVQVYAIDYGGGSLAALAGAPHLGDVAGRVERDKVRRTVDRIWSLVEERDARFRELGVDSPATMRRRRAEGAIPPELGCDVLLVVDGWGAAREDLEDLEPRLMDVAARGQRVGVHLLLTANRWAEVRSALREQIGGRLELRLNDPAESEIDRRAAAALPAGVPGRGLAPDGRQVQIALPDLGADPGELAGTAARLWSGPRPTRIPLLPPLVRPEDLPAPGQDPEPGVPIGIDELELAPVYLDLEGTDPHFLILGDSESGKTTLLRSWMAGLQARRDASRAMFLVIDYRRTLLDACRPEQLWAYGGAAPAAGAAVRELAQGIVERLPPANLSPDAIASRSWWTGPDLYVVVDDYDLVASPAGNPLLPLVELLAQGRDLGLHLVLARRVGGMARSGFEPVLARLRELHSPGLILSGDPTEGPLLGLHRAAPQPPGRGLLVRRRRPPVLVQTVSFSRNPS
jgi:S-DNA-T family DNA segregation ATPase FtsK/SpoIIIE